MNVFFVLLCKFNNNSLFMQTRSVSESIDLTYINIFSEKQWCLKHFLLKTPCSNWFNLVQIEFF